MTDVHLRVWWICYKYTFNYSTDQGKQAVVVTNENISRPVNYILNDEGTHRCIKLHI